MRQFLAGFAASLMFFGSVIFWIATKDGQQGMAFFGEAEVITGVLFSTIVLIWVMIDRRVHRGE